MKNILVIADHYLPAYKAGGAVQTLANMVDWLGDEFCFRVVTRSTDIGEEAPLSGVQEDKWQHVGKATVFYTSSVGRTPLAWRALLNSVAYDVLYLNSYFSTLTVQTLALLRLGLISNTPVVLAPRGEFSQGALELKATKKKIYRQATQLAGLYRNLIWQASSEVEAQEIATALSGSRFGPKRINICIATDMPPRVTPNDRSEHAQFKEPGTADIAFVSRISPKKNLAFALRLLAAVKAPVIFNIYGPIEDQEYWRVCCNEINRLPAHIQVCYHGSIEHDQVNAIFAKHHLFFFPTRGENFGHVILEALTAGCPVLISDQTPWHNLASTCAGWDFPLKATERFEAAIKAMIDMSDVEFQRWSDGARLLGTQYLTDPEIIVANKAMFLRSLEN